MASTYTTRACDSCGGEYRRQVRQDRQSRFCSRACKNKKIKKLCAWCDQPFEIRPGEAAVRQYCGRACSQVAVPVSRKSRRPAKSCAYCGKPYKPLPCEYEQSRYCSDDCRREFRRRGALELKEKTCAKCLISKPASEFSRYFIKGIPRYWSRCNSCVVEDRRSSTAKQSRHRAYLRRKAAGYNEVMAARYKARMRALRRAALSAYGGKCACCGEGTEELLAIDHVNNDGGRHRKVISSIYVWLKRNNYPKDNFQVLCHNCNAAKALYGSCPHQPGHRAITDLLHTDLAGKISRERSADAHKRITIRLKLETIAAYGGQCACCGVTDYEFLSIDHIAGDRTKELRPYKLKGTNLYRWLKGQGFPKSGYQLLCHSCNLSKGLYGSCPHRQAAEQAAA